MTFAQMEIESIKKLVEAELAPALELIPLTDTQRALFINLASRIYNKGHMDALRSLTQSPGDKANAK